MELLAHRGRFGHRGDGLRPEVFRMGAREPDTSDAGHRADRTEQVGEQGSRPQGTFLRPSFTCDPDQIGPFGCSAPPLCRQVAAV